MIGLEDIRKDQELINAIDWDMTPEEAVTLYLEWGNNWSHGKMVRSKNDVSHYFLINSWNNPPNIYLVRRNSAEAVELASIKIPGELRDRFMKTISYNKGVYGLTDEIKAWLQEQLNMGQ